MTPFKLLQRRYKDSGFKSNEFPTIGELVLYQQRKNLLLRYSSNDKILYKGKIL